MKALFDAIKTKYLTIAGLYPAVDGPFFGVAPAGGPFPFCAVYMITSLARYTFDQTNRAEEYEVQFTIRGPGPAALAAYAELLVTAYDRTALTLVTGQNFVDCKILEPGRIFATDLKDGLGNQVHDCVIRTRFEITTVK